MLTDTTTVMSALFVDVFCRIHFFFLVLVPVLFVYTIRKYLIWNQTIFTRAPQGSRFKSKPESRIRGPHFILHGSFRSLPST